MDSQRISKDLESAFEKIHLERMQGIPILNPRLKVEAIGFELLDIGCMGVLITPWLMNLVLIPESTKHEQLRQDDQVTHSFPAKAYTFTVNEIEGFGYCLMHSLYSPMSAFQNHDSAVKTAEAFLASLMDASVESSDSIDEERMVRYLNGEDMEQIRLDEITRENAAEEVESPTISQSKPMSRRDLIRGAFLNDKVESG